MKRIHAWVLAIFCAVAGVAIGLWFGVREGATIGYMIDTAPRGSIAAMHIQGIEAGKTKNTIIMLESEVDDALLWNSRLEERPLYPLLGPLWGFPMADRVKSLGRVADYRKKYVSPLGPEAIASPEPRNEEERAFRAQLIDAVRENQETISRMVARYSTTPAP